jgi:hypothetical protein
MVLDDQDGRGGELICVALSGLLLVEEHACVVDKHFGVLEVRAVAGVGVEDQLGVWQELLRCARPVDEATPTLLNKMMPFQPDH